MVLFSKDLDWAIEMMNIGAGYICLDIKYLNPSFLAEVLEGHALFLDQKGLL